MSAMTSALLRLYPRAWRRRYGAEMRALLEDEQTTLRTYVDLLAGAIDARRNPQVRVGADVTSTRIEGVRNMTKAAVCNPGNLTKADQMRSAAWMLGGSLLIVAAGVVLKLRLGPNAASEAMILGAFPASLMLSMESTYLKCYSRTARSVIAIGGALFILLMMWASVAIAYRI